MRGCLGLLAFVAACGGAQGSDVLGEATPTGTPTQSTDPPGGTTTPPAGTATPPPPPGSTPPACTPTAYYRDVDGDGFGGTTTKSSCTPPGDGWVTAGGDCEDNDETVFPGQTSYFATPYSKGGGLHSFDYDCNTKEDQKPTPAGAPRKIAASACTMNVAGNACLGDGYVPTSRAGPGTDPLCGSTQYKTCLFKNQGQSCETIIATVEPVMCR